MVGYLLLKMHCCCSESLVNKLMILSSSHLPRTILETTSSNSKSNLSCKKNLTMLLCHRHYSSTLHKYYYLDLTRKFNTYDTFRRKLCASNLCSQYAHDRKAILQPKSVEESNFSVKKKILTPASSLLHSFDHLLPVKEVPISLDHIEAMPNGTFNMKSAAIALPLFSSKELSKVFYSRSYPKTNSFVQETLSKAQSARPNSCRFSSTDTTTPNSHSSNKATAEQLSLITDFIVKEAPKFFKSPNFSHHSHDIVFENRIRGIAIVGLPQYRIYMKFFIAYSHLRYSFLNLNILKITQHPEECLIKVRWQIVGSPTLRAIFRMSKQQQVWLDGFSTFNINKDGKICKHIADNMMPDEEKNAIRKLPFLSKLAILLGLSPKTAEAAFSSLQYKTKQQTRVDSLLVGGCEKSQ